jgi:hypothetical protein
VIDKIRIPQTIYASYLDCLQVYTCPYIKKRFGTKGDGGYAVCLMDNYDCFLSGGIESNTDFENDILRSYPNLKCHAYDGSIDNLPPNSHPNIIHYKEMIGEDNNLSNYLKKYKNVLVKMDIEGSEFEWLSSLNHNEIKNISQLVIEWHGNGVPSGNLTNEQLQIMNRLRNTHLLVHAHANNYGGTSPYYFKDKIVNIPQVLECTYIRIPYVFRIQKRSSFPPVDGLDYINNPNAKDISVDIPPFIEIK